VLDEVVSKCIQHGTGSGLSRLSITSREWHDENKQSAKIIFGFESYDQLFSCNQDLAAVLGEGKWANLKLVHK
jgi:hypothetical protein